MSRCFALIPCAGSGLRAATQKDVLPKQYWPIQGKPMLWHVLTTLSKHPAISLTNLVLAPNDVCFVEQLEGYLDDLGWGTPACRWQVHYCGGNTRQESVLNGLNRLTQSTEVQEDDWVLVHDAARPGLSTEMLTQLIDAVADHQVGGILALPVADTLKRARVTDGVSSYPFQVETTIAREGLWQAQTPQIFRFGLLNHALQQAQAEGLVFTDEAAAVERLGLMPLLIPGSLRNLKITYADDLPLVNALMSVEMV
jgi:2-C-methyl-D-erythritol 4-phosphate cytidylyltransferase